MPLNKFTCTDFRCLASAELEFDAHYNLIFGPNASGKTSLLEAIAYLGRGRSFRGAPTQNLVRHGASEFVLFGKADTGTRETVIGVRNSREGLEIHIDGETVAGAAGLAEVLPLQIVDPDIHNLIAGGPAERRRYIDWIAFHVERGYLDQWRRFRRALKQRNAALKENASHDALAGWDKEFVETGYEVHEARRRVLAITRPALRDIGAALLGSTVDIEYQQGWSTDKSLAQVLTAGMDRDRQLCATQAGPQRADLKLVYDEHQARRLVSRGQQKLLACALILAATAVVQSHLGRALLLLLDDPAAELDSDSLTRLMAAVVELDCQVIATSLNPDLVLFPQPPRTFHVEQGDVVECTAKESC
ncbi:MAG: DNA replication/repair protein RecF [Proteobacteria bacterium]|nr:DNA replication/repair protein RecF [Pseudomonadota bacterium]